jgi:O-antigen/teichoic acid export membrane protein
MFSAASRLQGDRERIAALWLPSVRFLAAVVLPLLVGLIVVAPDLIPVVFGAHWHVAVGLVQILSVYVIIRCLQAWGSVVMDAIGRPEVTLYTQLGALCLTPIAVVVGSRWSIEAVAIGFVIGQVIAVEIPVITVVLSELRVRPAALASRLVAPTVATLVMAVACLLTRAGLSALGLGMASRAAATIALGSLVYVIALWLLAPDICRRAIGLGRQALARALAARRQRTGA